MSFWVYDSGGGPILPVPPVDPGVPEHPIVMPPGGAHPEHPIVVPPEPDQPPVPPNDPKPPPADGGWGWFPPYGWGYFPGSGGAGPKK